MASLHKPLNSIPSLLNLLIFLILQSPYSTQAFSTSPSLQRGGEERRSLLSFKETPKGANATFQCSPSGPCVSCQYSEKSDDKYRCSETGYHIPLKCKEIKGDSKVQKDKKATKGRLTMENTEEKTQDGEEGKKRLLDDSSTGKVENQAYITYRSCIPAVFEEKLSVLGFEMIMLGLLCVSGPFIYFKRKQAIAMSGFAPVRGQTNSRF